MMVRYLNFLIPIPLSSLDTTYQLNKFYIRSTSPCLPLVANNLNIICNSVSLISYYNYSYSRKINMVKLSNHVLESNCERNIMKMEKITFKKFINIEANIL